MVVFDLASKSRVEGGIKLLESLKELFFALFESIILHRTRERKRQKGIF